MSPAQATECLRRKAVPELEIAFTDHFVERLEERDLVMGDVFHILKYGFVYEDAVPSKRAGLYKYLMESTTPNSGGRTVCISVIPYPSCAIKLVTGNVEGRERATFMVRSYKYTACGLDDVLIEGLEPEIDDAGEKTYRLPHAIGLHRVIAHSLVVRSHGLNPKEMRFLRTEMGLTQAELAVIVKKDHQTIGRWERGETPIDPNAELVIRMLAADRLHLDPDMSVEEMAKRCVPSAEFKHIVIESAADGYHLKAA